MTTKDLQDLLDENFISADIETEGRVIRVISSKSIPEGLQNRIRMHVAVGVTVNFITRDRNKMPVPKALEKWLKATVGDKQ